MTTIRAFVKSHPLLSFYALAFAITWGGLIIVVGGPSEVLGSPELLGARFAFVMLAWLAGPSVASILMTGLVYVREGLRDLLTRVTRWRVGVRWYAVALLTAPLLVTAVLFALSLSFPEYLPTILTTSDKGSLLLQGIVGTLVGGIFEELGWTGFATPTLLKRMRYGVLATGLIVGVLWGVAHLPLYYWGASGDLSGALLMVVVAANILAWFPPYRVLWCGCTIVREPALGDTHACEPNRQPSDLRVSGPGWPLFTFPSYSAPCCGWSLERSPWPTTGISRGSHRQGAGGLRKG